MPKGLLDVLRQQGIVGPLPKAGCGGPAEQGARPGGGDGRRFELARAMHPSEQAGGITKRCNGPARWDGFR
jgi:hypothetical protein